MRLTAANKEKVRRRILGSAAAAFRERGVDTVSLDDVMSGAALTRGAFYAHFGSKAELVAEVFRSEHPLLRMLRARTGRTPEALRAGLAAVFEGYLDPANLAEVHRGCTLAALTGEAARAGPEHRAAFEAALLEIADEAARGFEGADFLGLVVRAAGAVNAAAACAGEATRRAILDGARAEAMARIDAARLAAAPLRGDGGRPSRHA